MSGRRRDLEHLLLADAALSRIRHDVRNRLTSVRNAMTYLRRRAVEDDRLGNDARVRRFFDLSFSELESVASAFDPIDLSSHLEPGDCGVRAQVCRVFGDAQQVSATVLGGDPERARVDVTALTIALRAMLSLVRGSGSGIPHVEVECVRGDGEVEIVARVEPPPTPDDQITSLHEALARRAALACGGVLALERSDAGVRVRLRIPSVEAG